MRRYSRHTNSRNLKKNMVMADTFKTQMSPVIVDNDRLETTPGGALILSDEEGHKNVVNVEGVRTEWTSDNVNKNMDMKIWQLLTPEGYRTPVEEAIDDAEEVATPPFNKPMFLSLQARNMKYIVSEGRAFENIAAQDRAFMPSGDSLTGGDSSAIRPIYLFYRKSHPLFYIREMLNYVDEDGENVVDGLEYKWTLDGDIVSDKPYFQMYRAESDDKKQWKESKDRTLTCEISNAEGSISQDITFRVYGRQSGEDGDNSHRALKGYYWEFDQERFDRQSRSPISKVEDPRFANREVQIKNIDINLSSRVGGKSSTAYKQITNWQDPPQWMYRRSRYRIDGGAWRSPNGHFTGLPSMPTSKKRNRPKNWMRMTELDKRIVFAARGGTSHTVEFELKFRYYEYYYTWWGVKKTRWFTGLCTGRKDIDVSSDPQVTVQKFNMSTSTKITG